MPQKKAPAKKQINPFEPTSRIKKVGVYLKKKIGSIFEKDRDDTHDETKEWAEDHEELGETDDQIDDEMESGEAEADPYSKEGRRTTRDVEDEEEDWEEGFSQGAAGRGQHGKYDEQKPKVPSKKVKETVKGIKKKK